MLQGIRKSREASKTSLSGRWLIGCHDGYLGGGFKVVKMVNAVRKIRLVATGMRSTFEVVVVQVPMVVEKEGGELSGNDIYIGCRWERVQKSNFPGSKINREVNLPCAFKHPFYQPRSTGRKS
jgi:hypothetical protein